MERTFRVLFVILGLIVIAAIFAPYVIARIGHFQQKKAVIQITHIAQAVTRYQHREGKYPDTIAELVLSGDLDKVVTDPWGHPYHYSTSRPDIGRTELTYYIWSLGLDNQEGGHGTNQDLGSWATRLADRN